VKKTKIKKLEEEEDDDLNDANILLLLSASKATKKEKKIRAKSPSKKSLKLLAKDADEEEGEESSPLQALQKQKFKRIMRQFVSSKSTSQPAGGFEKGGESPWSPLSSPKGKKSSACEDDSFLSPRESEYFGVVIVGTVVLMLSDVLRVTGH
jgi:hypothetical protein